MKVGAAEGVGEAFGFRGWYLRYLSTRRIRANLKNGVVVGRGPMSGRHVCG